MTDTNPPTTCRSCNGLGSYLINKTTEMEDSVKCADCGGTGHERNEEK